MALTSAEPILWADWQTREHQRPDQTVRPLPQVVLRLPTVAVSWALRPRAAAWLPLSIPLLAWSLSIVAVLVAAWLIVNGSHAPERQLHSFPTRRSSDLL